MVRHVSGLMLSREDVKRIIGPVLRGTGLGSLLGILPGGGAMLASFAVLHLEKKISQEQRPSSARVRSRAWPHPRPPTMPGRRPRSSRC